MSLTLRIIPPQSYLKQCFDYFPLTGLLIWLLRPREHFKTEWDWNTWNARYAGKIAGAIKVDGRLYVSINGRKFKASRVIYKWMTGIDPPSDIDHKDHNSLNDRWENLRSATDAQNAHNRRKDRDKTVPFKGVSFSGHKAKPFKAQIKVNGQMTHVGYFATAEEAFAARCEMARRLHGEFF